MGGIGRRWSDQLARTPRGRLGLKISAAVAASVLPPCAAVKKDGGRPLSQKVEL